jgi:predicted MarR family transcription regulator
VLALWRRRKHNVAMRIERSRENVFTVTATGQELSALVAAARMALQAMRAAPEPPPPEALQALERVLADFDGARERLARPPSGG